MKPLLISLLLASTSLTALAARQPFGTTGVFASAGGSTTGGLGQAAATNSYANVNVKAVGSASLIDGSLHAYAWSSNNPTLPKGCRPDMVSCNWGTSAEVWYHDTITLEGGADIEGIAIPWHWSVNGTTTRGKWWSGASAYSYFYIGTNPEGWRTATYLDVKNQSREITNTFQLPGQGESLKLYIYASLTTFAEGGAVADYSHTGRFSWDLPESVHYTSASGRFMTAPVPEPSSYALMLAGLAVLPWARRRLMQRERR
ncbi:PEP-CTERM sorting domain-containing protein [Roseateles sp. P5_E7]